MVKSLSNYELWKSRIADYRNSGLTARKWCESKQIKYSTLQYWIRKFNKSNNAENDKLPEFVPIPGMQDFFLNKSAPVIIRMGTISIEITENCHPDFLQHLFSVLSCYA